MASILNPVQLSSVHMIWLWLFYDINPEKSFNATCGGVAFALVSDMFTVFATSCLTAGLHIRKGQQCCWSYSICHQGPGNSEWLVPFVISSTYVCCWPFLGLATEGCRGWGRTITAVVIFKFGDAYVQHNFVMEGGAMVLWLVGLPYDYDKKS